MDLEKIGEKIKILRTKFGLTQQEVADALKIERSTYTYYELGKTIPNWNAVKKLAQIFQIAPYDLLEEKNKYVMSDILSKSDDSKNINICNLSSEEKKIILALRTLSSKDKTKAINSIDKIFENLKK
ncbi:MAG: helix-turn-helix domain-containing protein [Clostridia bacterium]|nr:helix-turn-helix domain-containing protein [Clostridia bacterium]